MADQPIAPTPSERTPQATEAMERAWHTVAESLGTTATAALMRRAAKRASVRVPGLSGFHVEGTGYTYHYHLPEAWSAASEEASRQARALLGELCALLSELTGEVVTSRLASTPAIRPFLPADVAQRKNIHASSE